MFFWLGHWPNTFSMISPTKLSFFMPIYLRLDWPRLFFNPFVFFFFLWQALSAVSFFELWINWKKICSYYSYMSIGTRYAPSGLESPIVQKILVFSLRVGPIQWQYFWVKIFLNCCLNRDLKALRIYLLYLSVLTRPWLTTSASLQSDSSK